MARASRLFINTAALLHNLKRIKQLAPGKKIIAMVKANAYGCGLKKIVLPLDGLVDAFGVACLEEALAIRRLGNRTACVIFQGFFDADELPELIKNQFSCVLHSHDQLKKLLAVPLAGQLKIWLKVDTGMHRLGFQPEEIPGLVAQLQACPWVDEELGIMTHLASADNINDPTTLAQLAAFKHIDTAAFGFKSIANSAGIINFPESHADVIRPGIMLYGVSPSPDNCGQDLGLEPVMRFMSALMVIHHYSHSVAIGYGGTWKSAGAAAIGMISVGYGDGYPRHVSSEAYVWINGYQAPIVGRISMDMLAVDLTHCPAVKAGDPVELWGMHLPVEKVAAWAGTIAYELLCQTTNRVRGD